MKVSLISAELRMNEKFVKSTECRRNRHFDNKRVSAGSQ
jgi:hypothetical protein